MRYIITGLFFLLSSFFIVGVGPTEAAAPVFEITPLVGYSIGGGFGEASTGQSLDLDEGAHYGLSLGLKYDEQSLVEVFYSHQETSFIPNANVFGINEFDLNVEYLHFAGTHIVTTEGVMPFVTLSVGATRFDPDSSGFDSEIKFSFSVGGGVRYFFSEHVGFKLEGRGYGTILSSDNEIFCRNNQCLVVNDSESLWQFQGTAGLIMAF
jgi:opacity protein-like surface antigen